jgi:hypothetical protein
MGQQTLGAAKIYPATATVVAVEASHTFSHRNFPY